MTPDPEVMDRFLSHLFGNQLRGLVELAWRDPQDGKLKHAQLFDLDNKTFKVKIDKVVFEEIGQDKESKPIIYFVGVQKGLVLNKTNGTAIAEIHGKATEDWVGKEVELFSRLVPFQGKDVPAIRVRAVAATVAAEAVFAQAAVVETPAATSADPNDAIGI